MLYHTAQNPDKLVKLDGDTLKYEDKGVFMMKNAVSQKILRGLKQEL